MPNSKSYSGTHEGACTVIMIMVAQVNNVVTGGMTKHATTLPDHQNHKLENNCSRAIFVEILKSVHMSHCHLFTISVGPGENKSSYLRLS